MAKRKSGGVSRSPLSLGQVSDAATRVEQALLKKAKAGRGRIDPELQVALRFLGAIRDMVELFCRNVSRGKPRDFVFFPKPTPPRPKPPKPPRPKPPRPKY
jgi:hypothetical protein